MEKPHAAFPPLTTNLVVADKSRTEKTICLAVSPSLKAYGIGGRARLFEVVQRLREVNYDWRYKAGGPYSTISGRLKSVDEIQQIILLEDGTAIPSNSIKDITI